VSAAGARRDKGTRVVLHAALAGNVLVASTKFVAAAITGSAAMLSEAVHSLADTVNEVLLLYGAWRAERPPDERHPFGYGREVYFWSFMVSVLLFALGAGVSVWEGVRHVLKDKAPDLVLSGVNRGANMAEDVTYSGTIAGAFEGTILGIRSVALSQGFGFGEGRSVRWQTALAHAPDLLRKLLAMEWMPSCAMNVNFPDREPDEVQGTMVTVQGRRDPGLLQIDERHDTWGNAYYWLAFERRRSSAAQGTDLAAVYAGYISVTPLFLDLTYQAMRERVALALA